MNHNMDKCTADSASINGQGKKGKEGAYDGEDCWRSRKRKKTVCGEKTERQKTISCFKKTLQMCCLLCNEHIINDITGFYQCNLTSPITHPVLSKQAY